MKEKLEFVTRDAQMLDAEVIAKILRQVRGHDLPYLPVLHTPEEDLAYIKDIVLVENRVVVAVVRGKVVGFCAWWDSIVDHLYVLPKFQGMGIGRAFLDVVKSENRVLKLWVFQKNVRAREFYEKNGFVLVRETNGATNEEREPDALYIWERLSLPSHDLRSG